MVLISIITIATNKLMLAGTNFLSDMPGIKLRTSNLLVEVT